MTPERTWKSGPIDCKNVKMKDRPRFQGVSKERTQQQNNMGSVLAQTKETMPLGVAASYNPRGG